MKMKGKIVFSLKDDLFRIWIGKIILIILIFFFISCFPSAEKEPAIDVLKREILMMLPIQSEDEIKTILTKYTLTYLPGGGEPLPQIEDIILKQTHLKYIVNILTVIIKKNIFSSFTDKLFSQIKIGKDILIGRPGLLAMQLVYLYPSVKLYLEKHKKTEEDWIFISDSITKAKKIMFTNQFDEALLDAYKHLKNKMLYFRLKAYKYFDEKNPSFFRLLDLYYHYYLINKEKESFKQELEKVMVVLKMDIRREAVADTYLPIKDDYFKEAEKSEKILFSFDQKESPLFNRKTVIIFFSLTCNHCEKVLNSLVKVLKKNPQYYEKGEIFGIKLPLQEKLAFMNNLKLYKKIHNITIPLYENDKSDIFYRLKVVNVPRIYFLNEEGLIAQIIQFSSFGHLDLKIKWFLDEFLQ